MADQGAGPHHITGDILFVGGGVAGMTAAIEAAETGKHAILIEQNSYLGGRITQMNQYFPKLCPPSCGLEINLQRIRKNPLIRILTLSEVEKIEGQAGNFTVTIRQTPRYVNDRCTACNKCVDPCPATRSNDFNFGLDTTKAIYVPHEMAFPMQYVLDMEACQKGDCTACVDACPYDAIQLDMKPETYTADVKSIVWATGWKPYDPTPVEYFGFGKFDNVITSVMMERYASLNGPTQGKILRPSDGKDVQHVAFVQCAGSRDENYLPYCSAVCCLASMKHATYIREQYPDAEITIFYIDVRAPGRLEDFYTKMQGDDHIHFQRGKVADIQEDPASKNLIVKAENTLTGTVTEATVDLVVLAVGLVPNTKESPPPAAIERDDFGFLLKQNNGQGIYGAGTVIQPMEVASSIRDAMSATLKAIQVTTKD